MLALYSLNNLEFNILILLSLVPLLLHCICYQFVLPARHHNPYQRKMLELSILALCIVLCMTVSASYIQLGLDFPAVTKYAGLRYIVSAITIVQTLSWRGTRIGSTPIIAAAILLLPVCDSLSPWNFIAAIILLIGRSVYGIPKARARLQREISSDSIHEAINSLPTGVMFADAHGNIFLANNVMLRLMQRYLGTQYRNADSLWKQLEAYNGNSQMQKIFVGSKILFRLRGGHSYLAAKKSLHDDTEFYEQLTITDVTEEDRSALALEKQLEILRADSSRIRHVLDNLEAYKRQQTLAEVTSQIHDLLGQRITILQQILNNKSFTDYTGMLPLVQNLIQDMRSGVKEDYHVTLENIIATYAAIGVTITIAGNLPPEEEIATAFVSIIREAATNSVRHSHANLIQVALIRRQGMQYLQTTDNGIAPVGEIHFGTGLTGIKNRVENLGGILTVVKEPRFTLLIEIPLQDVHKNISNTEPSAKN
jgi:signal transduction histidine kinase